jgi:hypothetical protein
MISRQILDLLALISSRLDVIKNRLDVRYISYAYLHLLTNPALDAQAYQVLSLNFSRSNQPFRSASSNPWFMYRKKKIDSVYVLDYDETFPCYLNSPKEGFTYFPGGDFSRIDIKEIPSWMNTAKDLLNSVPTQEDRLRIIEVKAHQLYEELQDRVRQDRAAIHLITTRLSVPAGSRLF